MRSRSGLWGVVIAVLALAVGVGPVCADGPVGGDRFLIQNDGAVNEMATSVIANSSRAEYLVVWQGDGIWGRRVSHDGAGLGPAFQITSQIASVTPDVAYDSANDAYLVVWVTNGTIEAQRLTWSGAHWGAPITIAAGYLPPPPQDGYYYDQPAVAYASTSARYVVVYRYRRDDDGGSSILARSYQGDGTPEAASFIVANHSNIYLPEAPDIAYNRSRNEYLVVWQQLVGSDIDVYGRRVKMTGGADVLGSNFFIANLLASDEIAPVVASVPTVPNAGGYLVAWEVDKNIIAADVGWDGTVGLWRNLATTPWGEYRPAVAGNERGDRYLVTWTWIPVVTPPAMMQVQGRTLALDGTPTGPTTLIGGGQVFDSAVAAGPSGDFLVAFDDNEVFGTSTRGIYGRVWGNRTYLPLVLR